MPETTNQSTEKKQQSIIKLENKLFSSDYLIAIGISKE